MNILTSEQMKAKQQQLLRLYQQGDIKFKLDFAQLISAKLSKRNFFCLAKAHSNVDIWIQKLVPLHKCVQSMKLEEEQNGIFKVITFVFLLIIFKPKSEPNHDVMEHLKCSLYSDDIDLLEVKNHSFNKKMKSDAIKAVIAMFFSEIQKIVYEEINKDKRIKIEDLLTFALEKNDMVVEGFHLFFRSILSKFDVEGANNCIDEVNPEQAIENLIEYFEIDCRIFNDLYLFAQAGIFLARIQENMIFGRYYENELNFQQTSEQEVEIVPKLSFSEQSAFQNNFIQKHDQIQKNDVKIFNFLLDTDRNTEDNFMDDRSQEAATPCFQQNDEIKFGKKTDRDLDNSFSKLKNRMQNERIHEISSEEELDSKKQNILTENGFPQKQNHRRENKFLDLDSDESINENDQAPTPMLGGGQFFGFGKKQQEVFVPKKEIQKNEPKKQEIPFIPQSFQKGSLSGHSKKTDSLIDTKQIRTSSMRRQSYQGSNQSKSSGNVKKIDMKTSKNQIKVMDGTSSQVNLGKLNESVGRNHYQFREQRREGNLMECEKTSSYSNCTCHIEKKSRMKLSSQILTVSVTVSNTPKSISGKIQYDDENRQVSAETADQELKKQQNNESRRFLFKGNANKSTDNLKAEQKKTKSPANKEKESVKSPQFLKFLRKDKSELIKKLTEKRIAKQNVTTGGPVSQKNLDQVQASNEPTKKFVKQSMFVGSYNSQNPQGAVSGKTDQQNRSITPNSSIDKHERSRQKNMIGQTKMNPGDENNKEMKLFKVGQYETFKKLNDPIELERKDTVRSYQSSAPVYQQEKFSIKLPERVERNEIIMAPHLNQQNTNINGVKPYVFYFKR